MKNLSIKEKCIDIPTPRVENIDDLDDIELTENSNSIESEDVKSNFCQWSVDGFSFVPTAKTTKILPAGYYTIEMSQQIGYFFNKQNVITNKLYRLPNKAVDTIMDDIDKFWGIKENYIKYNRVYRRNYLLYSAPGTGKTSLINLMCQDLIKKYNGIVVSIRNENDIYYYHPIMKMFRTIEPDRKMIVIIEDIDNFVSDRYSSRSSLETTLLNILDGNFKFDNTVIIATTNYPENLAERYTNRPSRFDKVIEFPLPDYEGRKIFISSTVKKDDLQKIDINEWAKLTENYSIDHLNELILLYFVFNHSEKESFEIMNSMVNQKGIIKNQMSTNSNNKIGFNE